jgi:hypothetical protein
MTFATAELPLKFYVRFDNDDEIYEGCLNEITNIDEEKDQCTFVVTDLMPEKSQLTIPYSQIDQKTIHFETGIHLYIHQEDAQNER